MNFKPMLSAAVEDVSTLRLPLIASPKLDGIRAMVIDGVLVSRNLKPIPNRRLQAIFGKTALNGLDGELIVGDPTAADCFRATTSGVMSVEGEPDAFFHVFDCFTDPGADFVYRLLAADKLVARCGRAVAVEHEQLDELAELEAYEAVMLSKGYEGVMLRDPLGKYKFGRGTLRAQDLMKLKRFADAEAIVVDVEEQLANLNEATKDNLGHTKRSTHKANKKGKDTLGALIVVGLNGPYKGARFSIGTGFDDDLRRRLWSMGRAALPGKVVKYKYFPTGSKDAPRFPVFLGFRDGRDM